MDLLRDRRVVLALGAVLALATGLALALALILRGESLQVGGPASEGGLVIETGRPASAPLTPQQALRCFVNGRLAGQLTLADCAQRNGVATGPLTVGVGPPSPVSPAAASPIALALPPTLPAADPGQSQSTPAAPLGDLRPCASYQDGAWTTGPASLTLAACVQTLFQGQCLSPGAVAYGRWGNAILELADGKVGIALDGRTFRTLAIQQGGCALPSPQ